MTERNVRDFTGIRYYKDKFRVMEYNQTKICEGCFDDDGALIGLEFIGVERFSNTNYKVFRCLDCGKKYYGSNNTFDERGSM